MAFPILTLDAQWGVKIKKSIAHHTTELGDNYQQVVVVGTNPTTEEWDITSPDMTTADLATTLAALETFSGDTIFQWSPDVNQFPLRSFVCEGWKYSSIAPGYWMIDGTLTNEPTGQCLAYANLIDPALALAMAQSAVGHLSNFTRDTSPFLVNAQGVNRNNFHDVLGRGGYLPPTSGTTEGQATLIRSLLRLRNTTGVSNATKTICLNLALLYGNALLTYFYPVSLPANGSTFYPPHWVINAGGGSGDGSFVTKGLQVGKAENFGHFGVSVSFVNGVGTIPSGTPNWGEKVGEVFRVHRPAGKLTWKNVYSGLIDETQNLPISYWVSNLQLGGVSYRFAPDYQIPGATTPPVTAEAAGKIVLTSTTFTGTAIVVYSSYTGASVAKNGKFDAFPMWRPLNVGESNVAFDSLWWLWDAYDELYTATGNAQWLRARDCTKFTALASSTIQNDSYLFKRDTSTTEPFSTPGTQLIAANNTAGAIATRVADGGLLLTVADGPELYPSAELQNFVISTGFTALSSLTVELASSVAQIMEVALSVSANALDQASIYRYYHPIAAGLTSYTALSLLPTQFVKWTTDTLWHSTNSDAPVYSYSGGGGSSVSLREIQSVNGLNKLVTRITFDSGATGFAGGGFVLTGAVANKPPIIYYKSTGTIKYRVRDSNAIDWEWALPPSTTWTTFTTPFIVPGSTIVPGDGLIQAVELVAVGAGEASVYWVGAAPEFLPVPIRCYKHSVVSRFDGAHQFKVGTMQSVNSSLNGLKYQPAAVPFTVNTTNGVVEAWRGTLLAGYESPSTYLKWGELGLAAQILTCLSDSQAAYSMQATARGYDGPFAPAYLWNLWSENVYGKQLDKWGWDAPDPNTEWAQYGYRALDSTAELWFMDKQNVLARTIVMRFIGFLDKTYRQNNSGQPPTNFKPQVAPSILYHDPAAAALIMRSAIHANLAGGNPAQTFRVVKRSWEYLQSQYVASGVMDGSFSKDQPTFVVGSTTYNQYFAFWHAEIIEALALLAQYSAQLILPSCSDPV